MIDLVQIYAVYDTEKPIPFFEESLNRNVISMLFQKLYQSLYDALRTWTGWAELLCQPLSREPTAIGGLQVEKKSLDTFCRNSVRPSEEWGEITCQGRIIFKRQGSLARSNIPPRFIFSGGTT